MENEIKSKKLEFKTYGTKTQLLEGIVRNRGKNFLIISEIVDRKTGELIDTEQKVVYEKYVDSDMEYIIKHYDDNLVFYPESNKDIVIIMKEIKPDVEDDIFTIKTAKGNTKRQPINMD